MNFLFDGIGCEEYYVDQGHPWELLDDYDDYEYYEDEPVSYGPPDDPFGDVWIQVGDEWVPDIPFLDFLGF